MQDFASEVLSEEYFNANDLPVNEVEDQLSRRRVQRETFVVQPVCPFRFGSRIERGAKVIVTATPDNESKEWHLFEQVPLILIPEQRG